MRILAIPIIKHGNKVNRKREIFRCHFLHLNSLSLRRQTFENCPHYSENSLPKKKLQLGENNESYARILQSVPIILRHTLIMILIIIPIFIASKQIVFNSNYLIIISAFLSIRNCENYTACRKKRVSS